MRFYFCSSIDFFCVGMVFFALFVLPLSFMLLFIQLTLHFFPLFLFILYFIDLFVYFSAVLVLIYGLFLFLSFFISFHYLLAKLGHCSIIFWCINDVILSISSNLTLIPAALFWICAKWKHTHTHSQIPICLSDFSSTSDIYTYSGSYFAIAQYPQSQCFPIYNSHGTKRTRECVRKIKNGQEHNLMGKNLNEKIHNLNYTWHAFARKQKTKRNYGL